MSNGASSGVGFKELLLLIFIVLKLTSVVDWSWLWVLSPLWIPLAIIVLAAAGGWICGTLDGLWERYIGESQDS